MSGVEKVKLNTYQVYTSSSSKISDAIYNELKKYGISISSVSSEARAKELIEDKKTEQKELEKKISNRNRNSEQQLIQDVKRLAITLGVSVSSSDSIKIVLGNLNNKIHNQLAMCEALDDKTGLNEIKDIQTRYIIINDKAKSIFSNQSMLNLTIDSLATINVVAKSLV